MAVRRESTALEMEDLQIGCSWVPSTPAKPNLTTQQLICTNWQEKNHLAQVNLLEPERCTNLSEAGRLPGDFLQGRRYQTASACGGGSGNFVYMNGGSSNFWQPREATNSIGEGVDLCSGMSFGKLLALAHARGNIGAAGNAVAYTDAPTSSSFATDFLPLNEGQFTISFGNPSLRDQENLQTENSGAEFNIPHVCKDGRSIPSRPFFDLNAPPTIVDAASSKSTPSQFEPVTPQKNNQDENRMPSGQDLGAEGPVGREQKITRNGTMLHHEKKEKSKLISNLLSATFSQLKENHKPDKGSADEAELIKTPQQKTRRKKHRPKVIVEGQNKRTPKSSIRTPNVPQDTRFKRKYVRRKGGNNVSEGKTEMDKSVNKRKYVRKRDKPEDSIDKGTTGIEDGGPSRNTRSSCRKSLNFNLEGLEKDNCARGSRPENNAEQSRNGMAAMEKNDTGISHECDGTVNEVLEVSNEGPGPSSSPFMNMYPLMNNRSLTDHMVRTRGKCQIIFSDVTHDKVINTVEMGINPDDQRTQKSLNDSICSSAYLDPEKQTTTAKVEVCNKYDRTLYNSLQSYLPSLSQNADKGDGTSRLQFPAMCKRRRTNKGCNMLVSSLQYRASIIGNRAKLEVHTFSDSSTNLFTSVTHATDDTQSGRQDQLILGPPERVKRRRSEGRKRLRDLSSLLEIQKLPESPGEAATKSSNEQGIEIVHESQRCVAILEARVSTTKKRSNRRMLINPTLKYNHQELYMIPMGPPLALTWKCMLSVDSITEQFKELDLNQKSIHNLLTEYRQEHDALVPFSFDQARRQHRPRVDLDDETTRVWKLLLEDINNEGIDGTNEENTKKWEEERRVFSGRANSFIARMRLVQGDRPFSPWKGSVVDSVVGVFLTQNVSDHLSSSAFMSLVARFPIDSKTHPSDLHEEKLGIKITESETYDIDQDGTSGLNKEKSNHSMSGEDTEMPQVNSMRAIDCVKSFRNGMKRYASEDNLRDQSTESSKCGPVIHSETAANKSESSAEDGDTYSWQKSANLITEQTTEKSDSCSLSSSSEEPIRGAESNRFTSSTFEKLLQRAGSILNGVYETGADKKSFNQNWLGQSESLALNFQNSDHLDNATYPGKPVAPSIKSSSCHVPSLGGQATQSDLSHKTGLCFQSSSEKDICAAEISELSSESALRTSQKITADSFLEEPNVLGSNAQPNNNDKVEINQTGKVPTDDSFQGTNSETQVSEVPIYPQNITDVRGTSSILDDPEHKDIDTKNDPDYHTGKSINRQKGRGGRTRKKVKRMKWDQLKKQADTGDRERVRTASTMDSVDWDAVRCANVNEIADIIKERGMNNMLAQRIKGFLNRLVRDHGSIDLEWLRDVPPDKAKEYLLSMKGLGLKSVECVRLLTLHHVAFPVDTNVGRIAVRLGWVPLQPLPESLQLHLLELYPVLESIQKYLWPRLCKLDQGTLYELHYQMITFGKVFCTKSKPNCNACPMRGECRHFASAFASARFALPAPGENGIISTNENRPVNQNPLRCMNALPLPPLHANLMDVKFGAAQPIIEEPPSPEPIIEVPTTPEPANTQALESTIESDLDEEPVEIPSIHLNMEEFTHNLQEIMQQNTELREDDMSKALVALTSEAASIPVPKLKNISRLRTEHRVYELPDSHPLLEGVDKREPDDPCPYLLAIWTPGETVDSIEPPGRRCKFQGLEKLCTDETCSSCNSIREENSKTVRGTLLVPSRTAMRGSFPLNGTYFQVNEVFSDHESSLSPFNVPRKWLWNLPRRTVFFGTSIPTIFKGLSTEGIQYCFWRGFVCVRGFDRKTRAPRPLVARLHFPASRLGRRKEKMDEEYLRLQID